MKAIPLKEAIQLQNPGDWKHGGVKRLFEPTTDYRHLLRPEVVEALEKLKEKKR